MNVLSLFTDENCFAPVRIVLRNVICRRKQQQTFFITRRRLRYGVKLSQRPDQTRHFVACSRAQRGRA